MGVLPAGSRRYRWGVVGLKMLLPDSQWKELWKE